MSDDLETIETEKSGGEISTGKNDSSSIAKSEGSAIGKWAGLLSSEDLEMLDDAFQDNVNDGELQFSRLAISQPLTPEVANQSPGWQPSALFDNITREIYSVKDYPPWMLDMGVSEDDLSKIHFCLSVPIIKLPTEYIEWRDRKEGGGIVWKTLDREDPRVKEGVWPKDGGTWGLSKEQQEEDGRSLPPPVTVNYNFLTLILDHKNKVPKSTFIVASYNRTSAQCGSKFANLLSRHRMVGLPIFGRCYWLYTKAIPHEPSNGVYYVHQVQQGPDTPDFNPNLINVCLPMAKQLSDKKNGRVLQERILNAATLVQDDMEDSTVLSDDDFGVDSDIEPTF